MWLYTKDLDLRDEARQVMASRQGIHSGVCCCFLARLWGLAIRVALPTDHGALVFVVMESLFGIYDGATIQTVLRISG